jgi:hypothetical protein
MSIFISVNPFRGRYGKVKIGEEDEEVENKGVEFVSGRLHGSNKKKHRFL